MRGTPARDPSVSFDYAYAAGAARPKRPPRSPHAEAPEHSSTQAPEHPRRGPSSSETRLSLRSRSLVVALSARPRCAGVAQKVVRPSEQGLYGSGPEATSPSNGPNVEPNAVFRSATFCFWRYARAACHLMMDASRYVCSEREFLCFGFAGCLSLRRLFFGALRRAYRRLPGRRAESRVASSMHKRICR